MPAADGSTGDVLLAAVLAGGEGRRMGGRKPLRLLRGQPLVAHAVARARRWSPAVVVVVRSAEQVAGAVEVPLIFDRPAIAGPLAGLAAALAHARDLGVGLLQTLPCDMPNLPDDLPLRLLAGLSPAAGAALPVAAGDLQPACGLWRVAAALDALPGYLAAGGASLRGLAAACGLAAVDFGPRAGPAFAGANSPEELQRLARETP